MLARLESGRAFEVLHRDVLLTAREEVATKWPAHLAKDDDKAQAHRDIALALKARLDRGERPELLARAEGKKGVDRYLVKVGDLAFPIEAEQPGYGQVSLRLYLPLPAKRAKVDLDKGFDEVPRLTLTRGNGPTTHLEVNDKGQDRDLSYAWALFEVTASVLRQVQPRAAGVEKVFDPVLEQDVKVAAPTTPGGRAVRALLAAGPQVASAGGPPVGHDLVFAGAWRGQLLAVTSRRAADSAVQVWLQGRDGWTQVAAPEHFALPARGASVVLEQDNLHVIGGVDGDGKALATHLTFDLARGTGAQGWSRRPDLPEGVAWPAVLRGGREPLLAGGVAGFYQRAGKEQEKLRRPQGLTRMLAQVQQGRWAQRAAAPGEVTGASTAEAHGCLFVGPGNAREGKVYAYDTQRDGVWAALPDLPERLGLGQVFVDGERLIYAGGFDQAGRPSDALYALRLSDPDPKWALLGRSAYCAGMARVVEVAGKPVSVMVVPQGSRTFHLDLGGGR
jgi:hypothetical protein